MGDVFGGVGVGNRAQISIRIAARSIICNGFGGLFAQPLLLARSQNGYKDAIMVKETVPFRN